VNFFALSLHDVLRPSSSSNTSPFFFTTSFALYLFEIFHPSSPLHPSPLFFMTTLALLLFFITSFFSSS
jgi:hypothetical protein